MDAAGIYERLVARIGDDARELVIDNPDPYAIVDVEALPAAAAFLHAEEGIELNFLESISGVDDGEKLWLVYHLFSYKHRHAFVLKVQCTYDHAIVPSLTGVWAAANWHEREQFDLFGFQFAGHPDLRRLLLPEDWAGHPLRKSYEYPDDYHGIDHFRPDPKEQFKALDELVAKAAEKAKAKAKQQQAADA